MEGGEEGEEGDDDELEGPKGENPSFRAAVAAAAAWIAAASARLAQQAPPGLQQHAGGTPEAEGRVQQQFLELLAAAGAAERGGCRLSEGEGEGESVGEGEGAGEEGEAAAATAAAFASPDSAPMVTVAPVAQAFRITTRCCAYEGGNDADADAEAFFVLVLLLLLPPPLLGGAGFQGEPRTHQVASTHVDTSDHDDDEEEGAWELLRERRV